MSVAMRLPCLTVYAFMRRMSVMVLLVALLPSAWAMHRCEDRLGRTIFQDLPCGPEMQERGKSATPAVPAPSAAPAASAAPAQPRTKALQDMTVGEFIRTPITSADDPTCVREYEATLIRLYEQSGMQPLSRTSRERLAQLQQACPELSLGSTKNAQEQAEHDARVRAMREHERMEVTRQIDAMRTQCPRLSSASERESCQAEMERLQAHLEKQALVP